MEQRKIIFLDVDGTLVDYSAHIPQSAAEAVRLARQKGHKVYICTGSLTVKEAFPDMIFGAELYRDDVNKISFILKSYEDYLDAAEAFPELKAGTWGGAGETALFGDAKVDIPMLEHSRIGVAMGNGGPEIRAAADYVTDDVECDGLWKAFSHLGLLE